MVTAEAVSSELAVRIHLEKDPSIVPRPQDIDDSEIETDPPHQLTDLLLDRLR